MRYKSCFAIISGILKFPKNELIPKTPRTLYMFEPKIFPNAKSTFFFNAYIMPITNSGREFPKAINESPITASDTCNFLAKLIAEFTNKSEP